MARRVAAYFVDGLLLFVGVLATQGALYALGGNPIANRFDSGTAVAGWHVHAWVFATVSVPFWVYYATQHASARRATVGKRLLGLRVSMMGGEGLTFRRALLRAVVMLVPFEWSHFVVLQLAVPDGGASEALALGGHLVTITLLGTYAAPIAITVGHRGIHDYLAKTVVEETPG